MTLKKFKKILEELKNAKLTNDQAKNVVGGVNNNDM